MPVKYRHLHGRDCHAERVVLQDEAGFFNHTLLFNRAAVLQKAADVREAIERDLMRIDLTQHVALRQNMANLRFEFQNPALSGVGNRLIRGNDDARNADFIVNRLQGHDKRNRRGGRIRNHAALPPNRMRVDFRHDDGNFGIPPKRAAHLDDHRPGLRGDRRKCAARLRSAAEKGDINPVERLLGQLFNAQFLLLERHPRPRRLFGRQQPQVVYWRFALLKHFD